MNNGETERPAVELTMKKVDKIDDWVKAGVNWQDILFAYSKHALTADDTIVDSLNARKNGLTIRTRVTDYQTEDRLVVELQKQPGFVTTQKVSRDTNDPDFGIESNLEIELQRNQKQLLREIDERAADFQAEQRAARAARAAATQTDTPSN